MTQNELILLLDQRGQLIYSRSTPECRKCLEGCSAENEVVNSCSQEGKHRRGVFRSGLGSVHLCTSDRDYVSSSKMFKKQLYFYSEMLGSFHDVKNGIQTAATKFTRRLIHNLTSLHAHILQDLYVLVPQESLSGYGTAAGQLKAVKKALNENAGEAPQGFLRILKNAVAIKTEFSVFNNLYSEKPSVNEKFHNLHRVIKNVTSMYFQDFQEKGVSIVQDNLDGEVLEVLFDYESVGVALHHLFQNAIKYIMNDTALTINFPCHDGVPRIALKMISLPIEKDEIEYLCNDGYSGKVARQLSLAGDGTGMGIAERLLELNGARIIVNAGVPTHNRIGIMYADNVFTIEFTNKRLKSKIVKKGHQ